MRLLLLALLLAGCSSSACSSSAIKDPSPSWRAANRMAGELGVDCNTTTIANGIIGCAFTKGKVGGNLRIGALYTGNIKGVSYNCKNFSVTTDAYNDNYLQFSDLYTATNSQSCSFTLGRTIVEGSTTADDTLMSRVFIKIIPDSNYYQKMLFTIGKNNFTGVGWHQVKTSQQEDGNNPILTIWPSGQHGTFEVKCGDDTILTQKYDTRPFNVDIPFNHSCDMEMSSTNSDVKLVDLGTYVYNVAYSTVDITQPSISIKKGEVTASFNDKLNGGYVVFGVKAESTLCKGTNKCTIPDNRDLYTFKAMTMSARLFWAKWRKSTNTWEIF